MSQSHKPRKVLVVDDDPIIRDMMVDILDFEGYSARVARNGQEALDVLREGEDYLVFLDLMMPVMDGREVCQILASDPQLRGRHIIILMSAAHYLAEAAALNIHSTMPKPFSADDVVEIMEPYMV